MGLDRKEPPGIVICSILELDAARTASRLAAAPAGCRLVEIRADHLSGEEVQALVRGAGRPVLVRAARAADGGGFRGSEEERESLLRAALAAGACFVDVELGGALRALAEGQEASRVILS